MTRNEPFEVHDGSSENSTRSGLYLLVCVLLVAYTLRMLLFNVTSHARTSLQRLGALLLGRRTRTPNSHFVIDWNWAPSPISGEPIDDFAQDDAVWVYRKHDGGDGFVGKLENDAPEPEPSDGNVVFGRPVQKDDGSEASDDDDDARSDEATGVLDFVSSLVKDVVETYSEQLQVSDAIVNNMGTSHLFGELLGACGQKSAAAFSDVFASMVPKGLVKTAETRHADVFRISTARGHDVLEVLRVGYIARYSKELRNNLLVARALQGLRDKTAANFTTGFLVIKKALCVWDGYPVELTGACQMFAACRRCDDRSEEYLCVDRQVPQPYLVLHVEHAGEPLHSVEVMSAEEVSSVFQQVILTLAVAETALRFEHRHLNLKSIFIRRTNHEIIEWKISGEAFYLDNHGVTARIQNFGAARADVDGDAQYTDPEALWKENDGEDSALKDVYGSIREEMSGDWSVHCPRTNVLFGCYLAQKLYRTHNHRIRHSADRREQEAWDAFRSWKFQLFWFSSLAEFSRSVFREPGRDAAPPRLSPATLIEDYVMRPLCSFLKD